VHLTLLNVLLVILGGLFGWTLGQLPRKYVFLVLAVAILLVIILFAQ